MTTSQLAIVRATFVIHMLRLYLSSAIDKHVKSFPPELRLTHIDQVPLEKVYFQIKNMEDASSIRGRPQHRNPYSIKSSRDLTDSPYTMSFVELDSLLAPSANTTEMTERLREAVLWFGRGVASEKMIDSYLFYAIATEAVLSTGNNSQADYARCIARLIVRSIGDKPTIQLRFRENFAENFRGKNPDERRTIFELRAQQLFDIRNNIAHGQFRGSNILSELRDLEDIVRVTIYAVARGSWATLSELRRWVHSGAP